MSRTAHDHSTPDGDDAEPQGPSTEMLRPKLTAAAAELSDELHRSPRPSEVAHRAGADVEDVVESVAHDGPIGDEYGAEEPRVD